MHVKAIRPGSKNGGGSLKKRTTPFQTSGGPFKRDRPAGVRNKMLAPTPCSEARCSELVVRDGKCQTHQRPAWQGSTRKQRLPSDWSTRRLVVLKRDKGICYVCQGPNADTVDHVIAGDDHSLNNLKAIHQNVAPYCHRSKSSQEGHQAKRDQRIRRRH